MNVFFRHKDKKTDVFFKDIFHLTLLLISVRWYKYVECQMLLLSIWAKAKIESPPTKTLQSI